MVKTADVIPGANVITTWGNEIRDKTVQVFASVAELNAAYPIPNRGQCCYIASNDVAEGFWTYDGTAWRPPWNMSWGIVFSQINTSFSSALTTGGTILDLFTGLVWTPIANRRYRIDWQAAVTSNNLGFGDVCTMIVSDDTPTTLYASTHVVGAAVNVTCAGSFTTTASLSGSKTYRLRGNRFAGTGQLQFNGNFSTPIQVIITDVGPLTGVPS